MTDAVLTSDGLKQFEPGTHKPVPTLRNVPHQQVEADFSALMCDGYVILDGLMSAADAARIRAELSPLFTRIGRNPFEGIHTQRLYNVLAKTRVCDVMAEHPRILALMDRLFAPSYLLSQMQAINILPGEAAQALHHDDAFYPLPRPRAALGAASIFALDDFTPDNGATRIVPGSHLWDQETFPRDAQTITAEMRAGSAVFFLGTTWHSGGANRSAAPRMAFTCQYCEPWLRQQENFLLELPRETVRALSPTLQSLIGYSIHAPFMGMVEGQHPLRLLSQEKPAIT